jgi:hypothetical protein
VLLPVVDPDAEVPEHPPTASSSVTVTAPATDAGPSAPTTAVLVSIALYTAAPDPGTTTTDPALVPTPADVAALADDAAADDVPAG